MTDTAAHKRRLRDYFDGQGFERWSAIYGEGELSGVRRTIRAGHSRMLALAEQWLHEGDGPWVLGAGVPLAPGTQHPTPHVAPQALDAGCGTGLFATALAQRGWDVTAVDIAPQMVQAAAERSRAAGVADRVRAHVGDADAVPGEFDAVVCFDVLIHYPQPALGEMLRGLARRSRQTLLFTYAPYEPLLAALHWVGGRFPQASRRTDIQMVPERSVHAALAEAGMAVRRSAPVRSGFYHVNLVEATRR